MSIGPTTRHDDDGDPATRALARTLARHRARARAVLVVERVWPALWPAMAVLGAFVAAALLDLPRLLPGWAHLVLLVVVAAGIVLSTVLGLRRVAWPTADEVDRRLESASGLAHRPLAVLTDRPALSGGDGLWRAHVARAASQVARLRTGMPRPGLSSRDPRASWAALVVGLVACLVVAGPDAPLRLARSLSPVFAPRVPPPAPQVQAWITPPAYTGQAPVFLKPEGGAVTVPGDSRLTLGVTGGEGEPSLTIAGKTVPFQTLDPTSFQAEQVLTNGGRLEVGRRGRALGAWELTVIADQAPRVAFPEPPGRVRGESRAPLARLPWEVRHEYGVTSLQAELRLKDRPTAPPLIISIPLPGGAPKSAKGARTQDLTANPWAGLPVVATLVAKDAPGLVGRSEPAEFTLPERRFTHPVARALMEIRKQLTLDPTARDAAVAALTGLADPAESWKNDLGGFLNLRAIASQLEVDPDAAAVPAAQARMWLLALHLEEGAPERTARALDQARQSLRELLEAQQRGEKVDPAELQKRMKDVEDAIRKHMQALAEQMRRDPQARAEQSSPEDERLDQQDMDKLTREMEDAVRRGDMETAREKMAELEQMLDELRNARPEHGQTERQKQRAEKRQRGQQQMSALQDVVRREGALLDTAQSRADADRFAQFQRQNRLGAPASPGQQDGAPQPGSQPGGPQSNLPQPGPSAATPRQGAQGQASPRPGSQAGSQQPVAGSGVSSVPSDRRAAEGRSQQALRMAIGELMERYGDLTGEVPPSLGEADTAMRDAVQSLSQGRDAAAAAAEQKAIEALQKGGRSMSMQMARQFGSQQEGEGDDGDDGQDGDGSPSDRLGDGRQPGGQQFGRDDGFGGRPWEGRHGVDRRADDRRDPLGRPLRDGTSGADESGETQVPDKMEEARTRELQDELRRRDGERNRPRLELDYIERLLRTN